MYENEQDVLNGSQARAGIVFQAIIGDQDAISSDRPMDETLSPPMKIISNRRTMRESMDHNLPSLLKNDDSHEVVISRRPDSMDFQTGPRCISSSAS